MINEVKNVKNATKETVKEIREEVNEIKFFRYLKRNWLALFFRGLVYLILIGLTISTSVSGFKLFDYNTMLMENGSSYTWYGWLGLLSLVESIILMVLIFIFTDVLVKMDSDDGRGILDRILDRISLN